MATRISFTAKEVRGGFGNPTPVKGTYDGATLSIGDGDDTSTLRGAVKDWVLAHLVMLDEKEEPTMIVSEPTPAAAPTPEQPEELAPAIATPVADLPPTATTASQLVDAVTTSTPAIPVALPDITSAEPLGSFAARALAPHGHTVADGIADGSLAELLKRTDLKTLDDSWNPVLEALGMTRPA